MIVPSSSLFALPAVTVIRRTYTHAFSDNGWSNQFPSGDFLKALFIGTLFEQYSMVGSLFHLDFGPFLLLGLRLRSSGPSLGFLRLGYFLSSLVFPLHISTYHHMWWF